MDAVWQKAVAIAPKFTAAASAVGSAVCCHLIQRRLRGGSKKNRTYLRLILGMSMCDFTASAAWFLTTWPIPRGTPGVYGAVGNQQTCSAQAFFAQFSLSTVMYNGSLALYYVLIIVKGWSDHEIVRIEPGDTVVFVPTDKGHNTVSIDGMFPDGAQRINIGFNKEGAATFDRPGI